MKKALNNIAISLIITLTLYICANFVKTSHPQHKEHIYLEQLKQKPLDPAFQEIHDQFIYDAQCHGFSDYLCKEQPAIIYGYLGPRLWGVTFPEKGLIIIDTTNMPGPIFELVVYHELGHYYFNLRHTDDYYSIMYPSLEMNQAIAYHFNKENHKRKFFRNSWLYLLFNPDQRPCD